MGRRKCAGARDLTDETRGGVLALVALFLPIAVLCVGVVVDLGTVFFVRKAVQAACDLGALAGVQELDWDLLSLGTVALREGEAEAVAKEITGHNLEAVEGLMLEVQVSAIVLNPPAKTEPTVAVAVTYLVRMPFLRTVPGLVEGFRDRRVSEASVVKRVKW